ncbi:MAG TPA: four helix bundle protein [Gemmatimonadales bacterium]|nr:four helix bundle protein [Gemmatimonadales bacterium]
MGPYERFEAWRFSHELVLAVYRLTATWPAHEQFGLTSQVRRAAASIPSNIAEGSAKRGPAEFRRFLGYSIGSMSELTYLLSLSMELGYTGRREFQAVESLRERAGRATWRLYQAMSHPSP